MIKNKIKSMKQEKLIAIINGEVNNQSVLDSIKDTCKLVNVELEDLYTVYEEVVKDGETKIHRNFTDIGELVCNHHKIRKHFNITKLMRENNKLEEQHIDEYNKIFEVNYLSNVHSKISMIKKFEDILGIKRFNLNNVDKKDEKINIDDKDFALYRKIFNIRSKKQVKPETWCELYHKILMPCYNTLCGSGVVSSEGKKMINGIYFYAKQINDGILKYHLDFIKRRNENYKNINKDLLNHFDIKTMDFTEYAFTD